MKVKKRFMIALAGAMILGVFGIHGVSTMASDPQQSGFMLTIPASLPIQPDQPVGEAVLAGTISAKIWDPNYQLDVSIENSCYEQDPYDTGVYSLFLKDKKNNMIPYEIYNSQSASSTNTKWRFYYHDELELQEKHIFVKIDDYSSMPPGLYEGSLIFNVSYNQQQLA